MQPAILELKKSRSHQGIFVIAKLPFLSTIKNSVMVKNTCASGLNATSHRLSLELIRNLQQIEIKLQAKPLTQKFKHYLQHLLMAEKESHQPGNK